MDVNQLQRAQVMFHKAQPNLSECPIEADSKVGVPKSSFSMRLLLQCLKNYMVDSSPDRFGTSGAVENC